MKLEIESAYIVLESGNPAAVSAYLSDVVGLMPGEATPDGSLTWRNDAKAQRVVLASGPSNDASCIGFEATSRDSFDATVARLRTLGLQPVAGTDAVKRERRSPT